MNKPAHGRRFLLGLIVMLTVFSSVFSSGGAWADDAPADTGTPVTEEATAPAEPNETATAAPVETPTAEPVPETPTSEATDTATEEAGTPEPASREDDSFSISQVMYEDPVVSPSTEVGLGDTFTISVAMGKDVDDPVARVDLTPLNTQPFSPQSTTPAVTQGTAGSDACDTAAYAGIPRGGSDCVFTWTFSVDTDATPGDYSLTFIYHVQGNGDPGVTQVSALVTMYVEVPPAITDPVATTSGLLHAGDTFTVTAAMQVNGPISGSYIEINAPPSGISFPNGTTPTTFDPGCSGTPGRGNFDTTPRICTFTWTYLVAGNAAPGAYDVSFTYVAGTFSKDRSVTVTVASSAAAIVEPITSPSTRLHPGDTFTITTGLTFTVPQAGATPPATRLSSQSGVLGLLPGSPTIPAADTAVCEFADGSVEFKTTTDTGTCRGVWSFQVHEGAPLGDYHVNFKYIVNGATQTRSVKITVETPPLVFDDPVVLGWQPFVPGQTFQIQTTVTFDHYWQAQMATDSASGINSWLTASVPTVANTTGQTTCETVTHTSSVRVTTGIGSCTLTWQLAVPDGTAPGDYVLTFANTYGPAAKSSTAPFPKSVTVTVGVRPGPPDPTPAPRLRVTPTDVVRGQTVNVSVTGFSPTEQVRVRWLVGSTWQAVGTLTTDANGAGSVSVIVPSSAAVGANKVRGDSPTKAAQTGAVMLTIPLPPAVHLDTLRRTVGGSIGFEAVRFPANSTLAITWRRPGGSTIDLDTVHTDASGAATGSIVVPATEGGAENRLVFASGGTSISVTVEVAARIIVSPGAVSRGQIVTVTLTGYAKKEVVRIRWLVNGVWITVGMVAVSNTGGASVSITVPGTASAGATSVRGDGTVFRQQTNAVTVTQD